MLLDTVDAAIGDLLLENLEHVLSGRPLDYLVVHHIEPDHATLIEAVCRRWPMVQIYASPIAFQMMGQFFEHLDLSCRQHCIKEGDSLCSGRHLLRFIAAPMVHWPEVMLSYDETDQILFAADAFGSFGAMPGIVFDDEVDIAGEWLTEARRYYSNIVGRYGKQVQAVLKKAAALKIRLICPLHGPLWRKDIRYILDKYDKWSSYTPEDNFPPAYSDTQSRLRKRWPCA